MKVYVTLNSEIKNLIINNHLPSNHMSQVWRLLSDTESYIGFNSLHLENSIPQCTKSILSEHLTVGNYLLELEVDTDDVIEVLSYSDYLKLSKASTIHTVSQLSDVITRAQRVVNYAPVIAIIFKNLKLENVKRVFRYSNSNVPWVECEIRDNKLYHKVK